MSDVFEGMIGHEVQTAYLRAILAKKRLAHAYCFSGAAHLGKTSIAEHFSAAALGIAHLALASHPDVIQVDLPVDEKTGEAKSSISVEQIRDLREALQLSSFSGGMRVAIVHHADRMTVGAQNALLKTLEEPRANTLIILIAESAERLLSTIRSRSVLLRFGRVPRETICSALRAQGVGQEEAHELAGLAGGRPGVSTALRDKSFREEVKERYNEMDALVSGTLANQIAASESFVKGSSRQALADHIGLLQQILHDQLLTATGCSAWAAREVATDRPIAQIAGQLQAALEAREAVSKNQSANLLFERVILHT